MQIIAKTGFDISNVKSCLLGKNVKKISKCCLLKKISRLLRIKVLAFSIYIIYMYIENPSFFKMSFKMSFLTFYMFESLDGLWVGGGEGSEDNSEIL